MDISKAFSTIDYSLLIAKLNAYGFSTDSLRTIIENSYSFQEENIAGLPQGSVFGSLLSNIFINHLFVFPNSNKINYADANIFYVTDDCFAVITEYFSADLITSHSPGFMIHDFECYFMNVTLLI